jgi:ABC-type sugar transport system ATPase subunit
MTGGLLPLWELRGIHKAFPGVEALVDVSLSVEEGRIHALVGENGSGKSTLAKCLTGAHQPDQGQILRQGAPVVLHDPGRAQELGVAAFYQEFSLVPSLSVAENICLGQLPTRRGSVDWRETRKIATAALGRLSITLDPDRPVSALSVAEQQLVEIAKAISREMSLVILDEPTAALGPNEVRRLHEVVQLLASQGAALLYISHRLDEVFQVAEKISVLKDGRLVSTVSTEEASVQQIVRMMIGSDLADAYPRRRSASSGLRVEARDLVTANGVRGVNLQIAAGEIFGLGGVVGSGRTEIARALAGVDRIVSGELRIDGRPIHPRDPADAIAAGIALLPENRKADGLFFNFTAPPNMTISRLRAIQMGPLLSLARERRRSRELMRDLRVDRRAEDRSVRFLSGGNQQKVVLARWLFADARLLILDEPTQGVDVSAKLEVYGMMNDLTGRGISILLISSDYPELLQMSDRLAVVRDGRIVGTAEHGELTEHELVELATSESRQGAA